jgi:DNA-binding PadR family transcriptional regulator
LRREFLRSPSPHWSGSAGAIYPLVERLERRNCIRSEPHSTGHRRSRKYRLTPAGLRALHRWLGPPLSPRTIGVPSDPLRTRVEFIAALPARQQARFLAEAETKVRQHLRVVVEDCRRWKQRGDFSKYWTARGARQMLRARLDWIRAFARARSHARQKP